MLIRFLVPASIAAIVTIIISLFLKFLLRNKINAHTLNNDTNSLKNIKHAKIFVVIVVFILSFFVSCQWITLDYMIKNTVYDVYGNEYYSLTDVPLYDENSVKYHYYTNKDKTDFFYINEKGEKYDSKDVYLTTGGYIVFLEEDKIQSYNGLYDTVYEDGEHYYAVIHPCWNEDGDLIVDPDAIMFSDGSIIITKEEQENYRNSHNVELQAS